MSRKRTTGVVRLDFGGGRLVVVNRHSDGSATARGSFAAWSREAFREALASEYGAGRVFEPVHEHEYWVADIAAPPPAEGGSR